MVRCSIIYCMFINTQTYSRLLSISVQTHEDARPSFLGAFSERQLCSSMIGCIGITLVRPLTPSLTSISCKSKSTISHRGDSVQHISMAQCYNKLHQSITPTTQNSLKGGLPKSRSSHHNRNHETLHDSQAIPIVVEFHR